MMQQLEYPSRHLSDGDLMRYIDGEGESRLRERWSAHEAGCDVCASAVATAREESAALAAWLARAEFEGPADAAPARLDAWRRAPRPAASDRAQSRSPAAATWLRAAAILLLVAGPVVAVPAAREWVAERLSAVGSAVSPAGEAAAPVAPGAPGTASLRFVPEPGSFSLILVSGEAGRSLTVGRAAGPEAVFRGPGEAATLVSARALRVDDSATPRATFTLLVPAAVTEVVVRNGERETRIGGRQLDTGRVLRLRP